MKKADFERKMRSADTLFDAVGMIDDRIVAEAADFYAVYNRSKSIKKPTFLRRYAVSLAALFLVVMTIGGFVTAKLSNVFYPDFFNGNHDNDALIEDTSTKPLEFVLEKATSSPNTVSLSFEQIDFFDGEVSIIWNYEGEEEYHKLTFEDDDAESLVKNCMSSSVEQIPAGEEDKYSDCYVWISYGNGEVVSPYLKESAGNVGYATLFEYSPEVVPSESFNSLVEQAFND